MIGKQKDGKIRLIWFKIPTGKYWTGGTVTIDGKCTYCGYKIDDHSKIEGSDKGDEEI